MIINVPAPKRINIMNISMLVSFLAPLLPLLIKAGGTASEELGKEVSNDVWEKAKEIWKRISPKVSKKPTLQAAVDDVAQSPEDPDFQTVLKVQLEKLFEQEPSLLKDISQILQEYEAAKDSSSTQINQQIHGKNNKTIGQVRGDVNM
jgi:hypothetical protein